MTTASKMSLGAILLLFVLSLVSYGKTSSGQIGSPAISPDGKLIAVSYGNDKTSFIYVIPVDTGVARRLTDAKDGEESGPSFSVDGKRIAYTYWPSDHTRPRIVIVNVDGSDPHEWSAPAIDTASPVFSPDDKTIVYGRSGYFGSYSPIAQPHYHAWNFFASDLDGKNERQLTDESFYSASAPSISPDGKSMVLVTEGIDTPQLIAVYSLDHVGKPTVSLRPHVPNEVDHKEPIFNCPNYLPDGSILFMAADKHVSYDLYRLNPETGAIEKLTNKNGYATDLKVSADGKTAAFLKWRRNWMLEVTAPEPYLLDLQSHKLTPLTVIGLH